MHIKTRYFLIYIMLHGMPVLYAQQTKPPLSSQNPVEEKLQSLDEKITHKLDSLVSTSSTQGNLVNDKLNKLKKYGENIPGMDLGNSLPVAGILLPESSINGGNFTSPVDQQIRNEILSPACLGVKAYTQAGLRQVRDLHQLNQVSQAGKLDGEKIDQLIDSKVAQMSEFKFLNDQTKELPEDMLTDLKRYNNEQALIADLKNTAVKNATDYFTGHMDKITQAQGMMSKLKKKYSFVPDTRDMTTATKVSSLKNEPFKKRLVFGFGFSPSQVTTRRVANHRANPISLDLSPNLMYRFNKLFSAGISGTYRASLGIENKSSPTVNASQDVYGASAIVQHKFSFAKASENKVWKGFFGHGEFEYLSTPRTGLKYPQRTIGTDQPTRVWHKGLLLGIGKQMRFSRALKGQIIFTYDFLHTKDSPSPKAWNIKFGFIFGKIRLKDLRF